MIAFIKGEINYKTPTLIHLETGGIGYEVHISLQTYAKIKEIDRVKLYTYLSIREDSHTLYGFSDVAEKKLFVHLISVSGIGPNTALVVLSTMPIEEVRSAIANENVAAFGKVKGVGPKTAKRIILDLKDKIIKEGVDKSVITSDLDNTVQQEALSAMVSLGFQKKIINKLIIKSYTPEISVEELIKNVLKQVSK